MNRTILSLSLICTVGVTAVAAQDVLRNRQDAQETRASWLIGATIASPDGETIGSIDDLLIGEDGTVTAAVVSFGGFLGFGSKAIAVEWNELQIAYDGNEVLLAITREQAEAADEFAFRERLYPPPPEPAIPDDPGIGGGGLN